MNTSMDDGEFAELLAEYTFGSISREDQQRLAVAVLQSPGRAEDFANAHEIHEQLADVSFRQELLTILDEPTTSAETNPDAGADEHAERRPRREADVRLEAERRQRWKADVRSAPPPQIPTSWHRMYSLAVAAVVVISVGTAYLYVGRRAGRMTAALGPATTSLPAAPQGELAASVPPTLVPQPSAVIPEPSVQSVGPPPTIATRVGVTPPLTVVTPTSPEFIAFERPPREATSVTLTLPEGSQYSPTDVVAVRVELQQTARVYAVVRGPTRTTRQVYPSLQEETGVLEAGVHMFSFAAAGPLGQPGVYTLRVFGAINRAATLEQDEWTWIAQNASFAQVRYTVDAPQ